MPTPPLNCRTRNCCCLISLHSLLSVGLDVSAFLSSPSVRLSTAWLDQTWPHGLGILALWARLSIQAPLRPSSLLWLIRLPPNPPPREAHLLQVQFAFWCCCSKNVLPSGLVPVHLWAANFSRLANFFRQKQHWTVLFAFCCCPCCMWLQGGRLGTSSCHLTPLLLSLLCSVHCVLLPFLEWKGLDLSQLWLCIACKKSALWLREWATLLIVFLISYIVYSAQQCLNDTYCTILLINHSLIGISE